MDEITIGDKTYISSKLAAKITGYAKDYVGQLCREGRVEARLVGRNWYVLEESIREHRFGKEETEDAAAKNSVDSEEEVVDFGWSTPVYKPEIPRLVPELTPKMANSLQGAPAIAEMQSAWREWFETRPNGTTVSVQEYQEQRVEVSQSAEIPTEHSPDEQDTSYEEESLPEDREVHEAASVPVARIREPEPVMAPPRPAAPIDIVPMQRPVPAFAAAADREPVHAVSERSIINPSSQRSASVRERRPGGGIGLLQISLLLLAGASLIVALIGTGNAERLFGGTSIDFGAQKSLIQFLEGSSTYESAL